MSSKPVYIPRGKRLHGAFQGGFSAGYFNTVGSKEGWTPKTEARLDHQRPEDFMDDQDHNDWGGPLSTTAKFQSKDTNAAQNAPAMLSAIVAPVNVGEKLLRALGWRKGSSAAYVMASHNVDGSQLICDPETMLLSARRLRKIELQQHRVDIPAPKLDTCGLGFERFNNAPEFLREREKRGKLKSIGRKVYRLADVVGGSEQQESAPGHNQAGNNEEDHYSSFQTVDDFVGSRSVGGFALQEDEDDAYDDENGFVKVSGKIRIDGDEFDTVVNDSHSSDEDIAYNTDSNKSRGNAASVSAALSSWIGKSSSATRNAIPVMTSDGRPVPTGFVLGGTDSSFASSQQFPGPFVPPEYEVHLHKFSQDDNPLVMKALAHAEKLLASAAEKQEVIEKAMKSNAAASAPSRSQRHQVFKGIKEAMASRFARASLTSECSSSLPAGLTTGGVHPSPTDCSAKNSSQDSVVSVKGSTLSMKRKTVLFVPEKLLCKRFHVDVPVVSKMAQSNVEQRSKEEAYFQDEILSKVKQMRRPSQLTELVSSENDLLHLDERPSSRVYHSIFNTAEDHECDSSDCAKDSVEQAQGAGSRQVPSSLDAKNDGIERRLVVRVDDDQRKRRRSRSWSSSSSRDNVSGSEKKKRKDKKRKTKRKKEHRRDARKHSKKHKKKSSR